MPKYYKGYLQKKRTTQKKKFYIKDFHGKCDQIPSFLRIFTFTGEIINGKLHFLCSDVLQKKIPHYSQYMHSGKTCTSVNLMITIRMEEWRRKVQKVFFTRSIDKYGVT